jgi:hypothetical protein
MRRPLGRKNVSSRDRAPFRAEQQVESTVARSNAPLVYSEPQSISDHPADETDDAAFLFLDENESREAATLTAAADLELLVKRAVQAVKFIPRRRKGHFHRHIPGARLEVADRRLPGDVNYRLPCRRDLRIGPMRSHGQGDDRKEELGETHGESPQLMNICRGRPLRVAHYFQRE